MSGTIRLDVARIAMPLVAHCLVLAGPPPRRWFEHRPWCDRAWAAFEALALDGEVRDVVGLAIMRIELDGHHG